MKKYIRLRKLKVFFVQTHFLNMQITILRLILFTIGLVLFVDGFILFLFKKVHLGTIIPVLLGIVFISTALAWHKIQNYLNQHLQLQRFWRVGWIGFTLWCISLAGFFLYIHSSNTQSTTHQPVQAIIVLGSGITQGKPSAALAARLDTAAKFAKQQTDIPIIVSGGLDFGEMITEAKAMSQYLQEQHHILAQRILLEDQSTSTELNLKNSQIILKQYQLSMQQPIAIVTSDFHTLRAEAIAHKQGYTNVLMVSAPTPLSIRYNAWLREYFAYLSGWLLNEY